MKKVVQFAAIMTACACLYTASSSAQTIVTLFSESFGTSLGQFTSTNNNGGASWTWKNNCTYSNSSGHTTTGAAMFVGGTCTFAGTATVTGELVSNAFLLPPIGPITLTWNYDLVNECGTGTTCTYDHLYCEISTNNGASWTTLYDHVNTGGSWSARSQSLLSYAGQTVKLRFRFNSVDGAVNNYDGVYVDDVLVTGPALTDLMIANPTSLSFSAESFGAIPASKTFNLTTSPTQFGWWLTLTQAPTPDWMSGTPASGAGNTTISANILRTDLNPGTYNGTIRANAATAAPVDVAVTYNIIPRVEVSPASNPTTVKFGCNPGSSLTKALFIDNSGGNFNGGLMQWTATTADPLISIVQGTGLEGQPLIFTVNSQGLQSGQTYYSTINISAFNNITGIQGSNSPYSLTVKIDVEPVGPVSETKSVSNTFTDFMNSASQVIAKVRSNSGTIANFTVNMTPCQIPNGFSRVRYVRRYYSFLSSSPTPNVDLVMYYTTTEAAPLVTNPLALTGWQQQWVPGSWVNKGGISDPNEQTVTLSGVTNIAGRFSMAHPWVPKQIHLDVTAGYDRNSGVVKMNWATDIDVDAEGFIVERVQQDRLNDEVWDLAGTVSGAGAGDYAFAERMSGEDTYFYRISALDKEGNEYQSQVFAIRVSSQPMQFSLGQNYPNPFNPSTAIEFSLPNSSRVTLKVYDSYWREVRTLVNEERGAGSYRVDFDATSLPSGVYFYRMDAEGFTATRKMNLMK